MKIVGIQYFVNRIDKETIIYMKIHLLYSSYYFYNSKYIGCKEILIYVYYSNIMKV